MMPGGILSLPARPVICGFYLALLAGCSGNFPVLVQVDPSVDVPKAVDIVWVLTESRVTEIDPQFKGKMSEYFKTGRSNLSPGFFRFHHFLLPGQQWTPGDNEPLQVRSAPDKTKMYGPYEDPVPKNAVMGYLFINYDKSAEKAQKQLPMMIYPKLPTFPGYEDRAPGGISIKIDRDDFFVKPYESEDPAVIQEAILLRNALGPAAKGP